MTLRLNLVLQGGGVRGIAYVGALESMPKDLSLHTVAGTSAGSIVAALLALGRQSEIEALMKALDFGKLLDAKEQKRMTRLKSLFANTGEGVGGARMTATLFWRCAKMLFRPIADFGYLIKHRGLHTNVYLKGWLDGVFGDLTFNDIKTAELFVVASDVSSRDFVTYCKAKYPSKKLSEAVLASASIPLFFRPVIEIDRVLVDGGVLSNFPSHLFEHSEYPTVGLRLEGQKEKHSVDTFGRYMGGMLDTMLEAHDKERMPQAHFTQYGIDTKDVSSFDFALTDAQMPTSLSFALSAFDERGRGTAVGVWAAVGAVAASGGPVLGGLLIALSWRWIFLINVPLVVVTAIVGLRSVPADGERLARRLDGLGALLVFAATGLTCTALVQISTWGAWEISVVLLGAALFVAAFVTHIRRYPEPIVAPRLFRARRFADGSIGIGTYFVGFAAILLGTTLLLTEVWHYSALRTASAIAPGPMVASCLAPFAGRIAPRVGFRTLVMVGMTLFGLAGAWPLIMFSATPRYAIVVLPSLILWGLCNGLVQPALFGTASAAPASDLSSATAVLTMARQLGSAVGVALLVAVVGSVTVVSPSGLRRVWILVIASAVVTALAGLRRSTAQDSEQVVIQANGECEDPDPGGERGPPSGQYEAT